MICLGWVVAPKISQSAVLFSTLIWDKTRHQLFKVKDLASEKILGNSMKKVPDGLT
jgi:hypothetical protein